MFDFLKSFCKRKIVSTADTAAYFEDMLNNSEFIAEKEYTPVDNGHRA